MAKLEDRLDDAVSRAELEKVKHLILQGADIEYRNPVGCTALLSAAWIGSIEIIEYLLSLGANINARDVDGSSALDMLIVISEDDDIEQEDGLPDMIRALELRLAKSKLGHKL